MTHKCEHFLINEGCPGCQEIKNQWYKKIEKKGFKDCEEETNNLLKRYSGSSEFFDARIFQDTSEAIQSSWPETNFQKEEEFLNHKDFFSIIENIFKHGNNVIKPKVMVRIWEYHCEVFSLRKIEEETKVFYVTIYRAINKLREFIKIMDTRDNAETVILRDYNPEIDLPFVYAAWKNAIWYDLHPNSLEKPDPKFSRLMTKKIGLILEAPEIKVKMACLKFNTDQIIGYSIIDGTTLEFVYVKIDYRHQGIATLLVKGFKEITSFTNTKISTSIVKQKDLKEKDHGKEDGNPKED